MDEERVAARDQMDRENRPEKMEPGGNQEITMSGGSLRRLLLVEGN